MTLIIHAPNVHRGGGRTLLNAVLQEIGAGQPCMLIADQRLAGDIPPHVAVERFPATVSGRLAAERRLRATSGASDVVLCMGNLPPLLDCTARIAVFLQNRYLVDAAPLTGFPLRARLRIEIERLWLKTRLRPDTKLIVQTRSMQDAARRRLDREALVLPFVDGATTPAATPNRTDHPRFVYPASAEPHKNHAALLTAWHLLGEWGIRPELHLTVDHESPVRQAIDQARESGLAVINHGPLEPQSLQALYGQCSALVFPSRLESFGLPLLEARQAGLAIVAAELDYVRDVVEPDETFDPGSPLSIARAVRRLLNNPEKPPQPLSPAEFLRQVLAGP
jgi:glycosyltransferase involved in cell wall biosynthesis